MSHDVLALHIEKQIQLLPTAHFNKWCRGLWSQGSFFKGCSNMKSWIKIFPDVTGVTKMLPKTTANSHHRHTYERTTSLLGPQPARILAFGSLALAARLSSLTLLSELAGHCPASWKGLRRAPAVSHLFLAVEGWLEGDGCGGMAGGGWLEGVAVEGWLGEGTRTHLSQTPGRSLHQSQHYQA